MHENMVVENAQHVRTISARTCCVYVQSVHADVRCKVGLGVKLGWFWLLSWVAVLGLFDEEALIKRWIENSLF